jgi:hypothetical protein
LNKKATLDECREMLVRTSWQFTPQLWKETFSAWLEDNGWTYDGFREAMRAEYNRLTGDNWVW